MDSESYTVDLHDDGVAVVTFDRPPVNAMARETYAELGALCSAIDDNPDIRVIVLRAPDNNRAWCAGADLKQLVVASAQERALRYETINDVLSRFYHLQRPVVGALNGSCIGMGMVLAALCDIRVGADDAIFTLPEVERGMAAPIGVFLARLNVPSGFTREMLFTGGKYTARDMAWTGFFNYITTRPEVTDRAIKIAKAIAKHRPTAIAASKVIENRGEAVDWAATYRMGQEFSVGLAAAPDARKEISEFLRNR